MQITIVDCLQSGQLSCLKKFNEIEIFFFPVVINYSATQVINIFSGQVVEK